MTTCPIPTEDRFRMIGENIATTITPEIVGVEPALLHWSELAAAKLDLGKEDIAADWFVPTMTGHASVPRFEPYATVYAGHQFGHFVPQLGDGRAVMIAEMQNESGEPWAIQLKGAGRTPYSRFGDGRAVMRSSIREYLCSEHMAALGLPTTRAVSLVATHEGVRREKMEPGAIVARLAPSFIRFGHFEYYHHTEQTNVVKALADHVIETHWPDLSLEVDPYASLFNRVVEKTAAMVAGWQSVGFAHGVMNTDNMSILGLTIDYGPFGFLDTYDPRFICNYTDQYGRYAFNQQPQVALWNLSALATAFTSLISVDTLSVALNGYTQKFETEMSRLMAAKIGIAPVETTEEAMWPALLMAMRLGAADYSATFRRLSAIHRGADDTEWLAGFADRGRDSARAWLSQYKDEVASSTEIADRMDAVNPKTVLRNWVAETAIRAVEDDGDIATLERIFNAVTDPFADRPGDVDLAALAPEALRGLAVSCSS